MALICDLPFAMSNSPNRRVRYAKRANLEAIDKALALVGGSHMAAAKLLDMEPKRLSNMVGGHAWLKTCCFGKRAEARKIRLAPRWAIARGGWA